MSFEIWIAYTIATSILLAIPGPTILIVVSYALKQGRGTGIATIPGVALGDLTAMTASLLGAGVILATSATLFTLLKWIGALYLVMLGIKMWRAKPSMANIQQTAMPNSKSAMFWNSYIVTALNPKSIVFFIAFVPQFVNPAEPIFLQFLILESTFVVLAGVNVAIWAILAGQMQANFQQPGRLKLFNRIGGSFLIGAGLLTASVSD